MASNRWFQIIEMYVFTVTTSCGRFNWISRITVQILKKWFKCLKQNYYFEMSVPSQVLCGCHFQVVWYQFCFMILIFLILGQNQGCNATYPLLIYSISLQFFRFFPDFHSIKIHIKRMNTCTSDIIVQCDLSSFFVENFVQKCHFCILTIIFYHFVYVVIIWNKARKLPPFSHFQIQSFCCDRFLILIKIVFHISLKLTNQGKNILKNVKKIVKTEKNLAIWYFPKNGVVCLSLNKDTFIQFSKYIFKYKNLLEKYSLSFKTIIEDWFL